jgi:hypothetical protein
VEEGRRTLVGVHQDATVHGDELVGFFVDFPWWLGTYGKSYLLVLRGFISGEKILGYGKFYCVVQKSNTPCGILPWSWLGSWSLGFGFEPWFWEVSSLIHVQYHCSLDG